MIDKPDTFDDRFGFEPRPPTGDPSVDAILPPYVPKQEPVPLDALPSDITRVGGGRNAVFSDNPLDAFNSANTPQTEPILPSLPTGNPNPYVQSPSYESHGGVDYSGRPSSLAEAYARGSIDPNSLTADQLARIEAELAANPSLITNSTPSGRRG